MTPDDAVDPAAAEGSSTLSRSTLAASSQPVTPSVSATNTKAFMEGLAIDNKEASSKAFINRSPNRPVRRGCSARHRRVKSRCRAHEQRTPAANAISVP